MYNDINAGRSRSRRAGRANTARSGRTVSRPNAAVETVRRRPAKQAPVTQVATSNPAPATTNQTTSRRSVQQTAQERPQPTPQEEPMPMVRSEEEEVFQDIITRERKKPVGMMVLIVGVTLFVLGGLGTAGYILFLGEDNGEEVATTATPGGRQVLSRVDDNAQTNQPEQPEQVQEAPEETVSLPPTTLDGLVYAHANSAGETSTLYFRPSAAGDRSNVGADFGANSVEFIDREGDAYAAALSNGDVYFANGDAAPSKVYSSTDRLVSLDIDTASNTIAISTQTSDGSNIVDVVSTNSSSEQSTFFSKESGAEGKAIFIESWNGAANTLLARNSCLDCEGFSADIMQISESGEETTVFENTEAPISLSSYVFSDDGSSALYSVASEGGVGPYQIIAVSTTDGATVELASAGEATSKSPVLHWANTTRGQVPAYALGGSLHILQTDNTFAEVYAGAAEIFNIYALDDDELIVGIDPKVADPSSEFTEELLYFNTASEESNTITFTRATTAVLVAQKLTQ